MSYDGGPIDDEPGDEAGYREVLVVAEDPEPAQTLARLARGAGARVVVAPSPAAAGPAWRRAGLVLAQWPVDVGASVFGWRREGLVLVCAGRPDAAAWQDAVHLGAEHVAVLPEAEPWLVARIGRVVASRGAAPLLVVIGGRGGAGASTLATALAVTAARRDLEPTLLDLDPLGGGLDLMLGAESETGLRWPDLRNAPGRLPPGGIRATAPRAAGVSLVAWERGSPAELSARAVTAVLECVTQDADVVVADVPRYLDAAGRAVLASARRVLVVVPAEVRAAAAAARVVAAVEPYAGDVGLVVRGPAPTGLTADAVADAIGLPLAGELRAEPGLAAALDRGEVPPIRPRGPLAALSARLLSSALVA
ncbi:MAG: septum site-determining protein Ssd [Kineosporiaceae bacterium]